MKKYIYLMSVVFLFFSFSSTPAQIIPDSIKQKVQKNIDETNKIIKEKGYKWTAGITSKSYLSESDMKKLCGLKISEAEMNKSLARQDSLYKIYKSKKNYGFSKILTPPDWKGSYMGVVEDQGECRNCWAHAAKGVTEGVLHYYLGYKPNGETGIRLDAMDITNNASCGSCGGGGPLYCGFSYILSNKVRSYQNTNSFPNYNHAYYTINSYDQDAGSIMAIKAALEYSPVAVGMTVYLDFYGYDGGIYQHTSEKEMGYHAVVIVGYNDSQEYWIVKNSWGTGWGEDGYFNIKYGDCGIDASTLCTASVTSMSCFAKLIPDFFSINNAMGGSFAGSEWAYLLSNTSSNSSVTIPSGTTLYSEPGVTLSSASGINFNVYGTLLAEGSSYQNPIIFTSSSGTWGGIRIYSSSVSMSYCKINNAGYGIYTEGASPDISWTWINSCSAPVFVNGGSPVFTNCTIANNSGAGILLCNSANTSMGYYSNNVITQNNNGLLAGYGSTIYASYGENSIYSNHSSGYEASTDGNSSITANNNYWGQSPPPSSWFSGNVTYSNSLSSDPNSTRPLSKINEIGGKGIIVKGNQIQSTSDLDNLYLLWNKKDYKSVYENCKNLISKDNSKPQIYSVISLMRLAAQFIECDIENELSMLTSKNQKDDIGGFALLNYAYYLGNKNRYDENLIKLDELIDKYKNTDLEKMGLFYKVIVLSNHKNDEVNGEIAFTQFENKFKNDKLFDELKKIIKKDSKDSPNLLIKNENDELISNYPNPFNPSTTITYSIPKDGQAKLVVYDILGKEIKILVNEIRLIGKYSVQFDANKLSSGTYYCRIIITPSNGEKMIIQQKQMQVLK